MAKRSKEWSEKISKSITQKWKDKEYRQKQTDTMHSEEYRRIKSEEMQKKWEKDEFRERMTGESHPNWNPNREEVEKPYGPGWYGEKEKHIKSLTEEQHGRDALTGEKFKDDDTIVRHHIDYDKSNNDLDNLCALTPETHGKVHNESTMNREDYLKAFQEGKENLKQGIPPEHWDEKNKEEYKNSEKLGEKQTPENQTKESDNQLNREDSKDKNSPPENLKESKEETNKEPVKKPAEQPEGQPEQPKEQPEQPKEQPEQPKEQPEQPKEQPEQPKEQLEQPKEQPKEQPEQPKEQPDQPKEQPDQPEEQPDQPEEQPDQPEEQPDQPEEQPDQPEEQPDQPEEPEQAEEQLNIQSTESSQNLSKTDEKFESLQLPEPAQGSSEIHIVSNESIGDFENPDKVERGKKDIDGTLDTINDKGNEDKGEDLRGLNEMEDTEDLVEWDDLKVFGDLVDSDNLGESYDYRGIDGSSDEEGEAHDTMDKQSNGTTERGGEP